MKFFNVVSFEKARDIIEQNLNLEKLSCEEIPLEESAGRRVCQDIYAFEELPEYHRSTVDGYAVKAANTYGAADSIPSMLKIIGAAKMGEACALKVDNAEAVFVPTGGWVPQGADTMIMLEHTCVFDDMLAVYKPSPVGDNIIKKGDDVRKGQKIMSRGEQITPMKCGLLAALGHSKIAVKSRIKVAIISTGDEIVSIDGKKSPAQIRDTNTVICSALCQEYGFEAVYKTLIKDGAEILERAVTAAAEKADIILVSGGSSIGARDYTQQVFQKLGKILVHGIAIKPGKPTLVAKVFDKLALGLPGHPMACLLTLKLLLLDTVTRSFGAQEPRYIYARSAINFPSAPGRLTIQPVALTYNNDIASAQPIFYKSGLVSVLAIADGYILIPPQTEGIDRNEKVKVYLI